MAVRHHGVSLALFILIELCVRDPLVNLRLYRNATYSMATVVGVLLGFAMFGSNLLVPLFLEDFLEYTALQAALLMLPGVALTGVFSPLVGKLCDQLNPRLFLVLGFLLAAASTYWFALMGLQTEEMTLVWSLIVRAGLGFVFPPLIMLGLHTGARGDQRSLRFAEYHPANLRDGRHCLGRGAARTLALCAPSHGSRASRRIRNWCGSDTAHAGSDTATRRGRRRLLQIKADAVLSRYLSQESLVVAFQDCFVVFALVFVAAAVASFCIPGGDADKS
jgi:hypothetical protein